MLASIPHQKFCFYHLPTRGRARIKLGDAWYVTNVSIIFDCSMLLYYLFWMLMGLFIHFYIILGTNLLTQGLVQIVVFLPISVFWQKRTIKRDPNGMKPSGELFFEQTQSRRLGVDVKEATRRPRGRRARPGGRHAPTLMGPLQLHRRTSSSYTKPYFHRRNLLYPWDPILGPFTMLRRRGNRSRRASTSTP